MMKDEAEKSENQKFLHTQKFSSNTKRLRIIKSASSLNQSLETKVQTRSFGDQSSDPFVSCFASLHICLICLSTSLVRECMPWQRLLRTLQFASTYEKSRKYLR